MADRERASRVQRVQQEHRAQRYQRFEAVCALHEQGIGVHQIARTLGIGRNTVRRFRRAEGFPERQPRRPGRTSLTPYEPYLRERWDAGNGQTEGQVNRLKRLKRQMFGRYAL